MYQFVIGWRAVMIEERLIGKNAFTRWLRIYPDKFEIIGSGARSHSKLLVALVVEAVDLEEVRLQPQAHLARVRRRQVVHLQSPSQQTLHRLSNSSFKKSQRRLVTSRPSSRRCGRSEEKPVAVARARQVLHYRGAVEAMAMANHQLGLQKPPLMLRKPWSSCSSNNSS